MNKLGSESNFSGKSYRKYSFSRFASSGSYRKVSIPRTFDKKYALKQEMSLRGRWNNRIEFVLSCIGFAVGLGNVWRFPVKCYEHGGGSFLFLYILVCCVFGVPTLFFEMGLGQFSGRGPTTAFKLVPVLSGIGWSMVAISVIIEVYYAVVVSWAVIYLFGSLRYIMPWTVCDHYFNTVHCLGSNMQKVNKSQIYVSSTSEYWDYYVTGFVKFPSRTIYDVNEFPGLPQWHLTLSLLLIWTITGVSLMHGIEISGKIMYFIVLVPYVVLLAVIIRGCTLPGAMAGLRLYLLPNWIKIYDPAVILASVEQFLFSMSIGRGGLLTYASFNDFSDNIYRDTYIIIFVDFITAFISGFAIFPILGYMANRSGVDVKDVITFGKGLTFVTYTEALATVPGSNFWTTIIMIMSISLGLSSLLAHLDCIATGISDIYPNLRSTKCRKAYFVWFVVLLHFLAGIVLCTPGGKYWFSILDNRVCKFGLALLALLEMSILGFIYGFSQLRYDFNMMLGFSLNKIWMGLLLFACPAIIVAAIITNIVTFASITKNTYIIVKWTEVVSCIFLGLVLLPIIIGIVHTVVTYRRIYPELKGMEFIKKLFAPPNYWGPYLLKDWLLGSFYCKKLLTYKDDPEFLKYRGDYDDIKHYVKIAEKLI